jgi:limonene-1,2-epoxide hydrolase
MTHDRFTQTLSRRTALVTAGFLLASIMVASAEASEMSMVEKSNVKLVNDFLKDWAAPDATGVKLAEAVTDDITIQPQQDKPAVTGKAAVISAFNGYLANGRRWDIKVLETFAKGPVITNSRIDASHYPGQKGRGTPVVGVFIVQDGKIKQWSDYRVKAQIR